MDAESDFFEKKFEGYETALDPDNLSLLSNLKFRRTKKDFSDKHCEHFTISKFVPYVAKITTDEKWKKATSDLSDGTLKASLSIIFKPLLVYKDREGVGLRLQAQSEEVKSFWISIETEKIEKENKLLELKIKQAEIQFSVDRTLMGNEAHRIFDQKKIDYALNSNENSIGKHSADDEGMEDARSYKHRRGEDDEPPRTPEDQITFEEESSTSAMSYIPANPVESFTSKDPVIDTKDEDIANIDKLEDSAIFCFSSDIEEILSLHYIMLIDLTRMKRPTYITVDERSWRASIRQPAQPDLTSFFGDIMKNYERMHMYPDSGKNENEDTVMHEYIHDTFKETFRDSNYDTVWANSESLSSKDFRSTYAKPFSVTRTSKVGGYNLYKVAIFCQGGINNILLCENEPGVQTFGGHICEGYIYFCMMDLEYDGIYRFFQLSEIKLARKLSEFNLVRKLILETYFFKCRIDSYYSNRNNYSSSLCSSRFTRHPTVTPKAPKNSIPD
ncbi:16169_t:CDS:10, partial [Funneliformis caledonium]